jgi:hypothetical protein
MNRRLASFVLLLAALGVAVTTSAGKPVAPQEIPITVTFTDGPGQSIQSDIGTAYAHGQQGVRAVLVSAGNLALDTDYTASPVVRRLFLDFTGGCSAGSCSVPFSTLTVAAFVSTSACTEWSVRDMPVDGTQACNLNVNFGTPGTGWFVRFGEYGGTTPASVTRHSATTWTIEVPAPHVAKLQSYPTKGRMVLTDRGDYVMPASLTVTQP